MKQTSKIQIFADLLKQGKTTEEARTTAGIAASTAKLIAYRVKKGLDLKAPAKQKPEISATNG